MQYDAIDDSPAGKWDLRYMDLARRVASWSKDPSTKVGAVLVSPLNGVLATGFNGFPHLVNDTDARMTDRDEKLRFTIHAEHNVVLWATRHGAPVSGSTIYVTRPPCAHCAAALVQAGVKRVIADMPPGDFIARWAKDMRAAAEMFAEAGVANYWLGETDRLRRVERIALPVANEQ